MVPLPLTRWILARAIVVTSAFALVMGSADAGQLAKPRFLSVAKHPAVAEIPEQGKFWVGRVGDKLQVRYQVPARRGRYAGVEVHELELPLADDRPVDRNSIRRATASVNAAAVAILDRSVRRDLRGTALVRGALKRIGALDTADELAIADAAIQGMVDEVRIAHGPRRDTWTRYSSSGGRRILSLGATLEGLTIETLNPRGAAARAGLRPGDRLVSIDGAAASAATWATQLSAIGGRRFRLEIARGGRRRTVEMKQTAATWPKRVRTVRGVEPRQAPTYSLGIKVLTVGGRLTIESLNPRGAAARAGLEAGDQLISADGRPLAADGWIARLKTIGDRPFDLEIERGGERQTIQLRQTASPWPVTVERTSSGMAMVRLDNGIKGNVAGQVRRALVKMKPRPRGIVLDLRKNGGGTVPPGIAMLDDLIAEGSLGVYKYGDGRVEQKLASGKAAFADLPIAVLIDHRTASIAEHVANVLAGVAAERGVVVLGERSYGKGIAQEEIKLLRGSLWLSSSTSFNAQGATAQGAGVTPHIAKADAVRRLAATHPGVHFDDPILAQAEVELEKLAARPTP